MWKLNPAPCSLRQKKIKEKRNNMVSADIALVD